MGSGIGTRRRGASSVLAICLLVGMLVLPAAVNAQSSATTQYTPDVGTAGSTATGGTGSAGKKSPNSGAAGANASGGVAGEAQSGGGGTLPFTGYPLTWLVALVAILLAAGLTLRALAPRLDRRHI